MSKVNSHQIGQLNEAIFVLRHFIELSARLLPFLDELQRLKNPTKSDELNKQKIIDVYANYSFDTKTSRILLNSDVLELIKQSFENLTNRKHEIVRNSKRPIKQFMNEHRRLNNDWKVVTSN
jgi:hypothetical protein